MTDHFKPPKISFVRELCKDSTEEEIQAAEARLLRYLALCRELAAIEFKRQKKQRFDKTTDHS